MDTCSAMVYGDYLKNKDEAHDVLSHLFDTEEIAALRRRDTTEFEIIFMSDLGEAHAENMAYWNNQQQDILHNTMPLWRGGLDQLVRCLDLNYYSMIWRRIFGRILDDMPIGYIIEYYHLDMYLENHGYHQYRNNTLTER